MRKTLLLLILICSAICMHAQDIVISEAKFINERTIAVYLSLTQSGISKVYDENRTVRYKVTADWSISAYLNKASQADSFYALNNSHGQRTGEILYFQCVDADAAERLRNKGVDSSDFSITDWTN